MVFSHFRRSVLAETNASVVMMDFLYLWNSQFYLPSLSVMLYFSISFNISDTEQKLFET